MILIVDDDDDQRELYEIILAPSGHLLETARSGLEALARIRERRPDVILTDVVMPGMDGLTLLERLHAEVAPPIPPVIVCTGFDAIEDDARRRGAAMVLSKPVRADDLLAAVLGVLGGGVVGELQANVRTWASAARRRAVEAASAAMAEVPLDALAAHAPPAAAIFPAYFGVEGAFIATMRDDRLQACGSAGEPAFAVGEDVTARFPVCLDVLATGASLLVHDAEAHPSFRARRGELGGMRSFVAVPMVSAASIPVGTLCLFSAAPHPFTAEDLGILEAIGRTGSELLALSARGQRIRIPLPGLATRAVLEPTIDLELGVARRDGHGCVLAVVETDTSESLVAAAAAAHAAMTPSRLIVGQLSLRRLAVFKRGPTEAVRHEIARAVVQMRDDAGVIAVGVMALDGIDIRLIGGVALLEMADRAHVASLETGRVERFLLTREDAAARPHH